MPTITIDPDQVARIAKYLIPPTQLGQAPNTALPNMQNLPTPAMSMPPQPTPAAAGFGQWSTDLQNQQKVSDGIKPLNRPMLDPDAVRMASYMTPPQRQMAPLVPDFVQQAIASQPPGPAFTSGRQSMAGVQPMPTPAGGWKSQNPVSMAGVTQMPTPVGGWSSSSAAPAAASQPPAGQTMNSGADPARMQADQQELDRLQATGSGASQIKNPWLRDLARVGDAVGTVLAPGVMSVVPGTTIHNWTLQNQQMGRLAQDQSNMQAASQLAVANANMLQKTSAAGLNDAKTGAIPAAEQQRRNATLAQLARSGQIGNYDADGNLTVADDPTSAVYQSRKVMDDMRTTRQSLMDAQTQLAQSKNDPTSPAYQFAARKLAVAQQNANAAQQRAQAYMGNYLKGAYNTGIDGKVLPGAPVITDDNGNQTVVGATNAALATKNQANAAQFNDVHGALDQVDQSASDLVQKGGKLNSPGIAYALSQPNGTISQLMQSMDRANLTPEERRYVQAIAAAHENVQALRKSAGGSATDSAVAKLDAMIPGAATPDLDYLKGQTGQIRTTAERLGKGATVATGGLSVQGQRNAPAANAASTQRTPPAGNASTAIPASAVAQLREGKQHMFGNGQVWTLTNGRPVRVK